METSTSRFDVSKRRFLQSTGVTRALAVLGRGLIGANSLHALQAATPATDAAKAEEEWHYGYCRMCMRGDCAVQYKVANGVLMEVKGNEASPASKGALCPRGLSLVQNRYNPYRVKAPLKRTNPKKGINEDPKWVEISWDEALDTSAKKFKAIHVKDPRGLLVNLGFGGMDFFTSFIPYIPAAFHTPNLITTNGCLCSNHYATELVQGCFPAAVADFVYCDYHITLGRTAGANIGAANGETRALMDAINRGMKLVVVDPRSSPEASKGEWVPIRPGSDLAFVLALINTILYEIKTVDEEFLVKRTNGPYLIGGDGGYLRNAAGKPQVMDAKTGKIRPFDDAAATLQLEGAFQTPSGTAKTGYTLLKEAMKEYTPEWAENQTTIPAATIRRIAKEFVAHARIGQMININGTVLPLRPVALMVNRGSINHQDGTVTELAVKVLHELVGALDVPGGCLGCMRGPVLQPDADGTVKPFHEAVGVPFSYPPQSVDLSEYYPHRHSMPYLAFQVAMEPEKYGLPYKIEGALIIGGNTVGSSVQPDLMAKALASIPFVVNIAYNYDESVALSDIVMPDHAMLERMAINTYETTYGGFGEDTLGLRMVLFRDPLPPTYNTRQAQDTVMQMFKRMDLLAPMYGEMNENLMLGEITMVHLPPVLKLDPGQTYTFAELCDRGLQTIAGKGKGVDWFRKNGLWTVYTPREQCYNYFHFPMGKTRYQIYFEGLRSSGQKLRANMERNNVTLPDVDPDKMFAFFEPVPKWRSTALMEGPKDYDLRAFNFKLALSNFRMGGQDQLPWLMEVGDKLDPLYDVVCMHPGTAAAKGLTDGQRICVESQYGKVSGRLKVSELFHPETVGIGGALGRMVSTLGPQPAQRVHYNQLLGAPLNTIDPVAGGVDCTVRVKVYSA